MMKKNGFALAMVLWISAILMASTLYLLGMYKQSVNNAQALNDKLKAELLSDSTIDKLKFYTLTGQFEKNMILNNLKGFPPQLLLTGKVQYIENNISLQLNGGGQMFSFYDSNVLTMNNFIKFYTQDEINYVDPYSDWLDTDSRTLLNGAEDGYYYSYTKAYTCSNMGFIQHPEELFLLKNYKQIAEPIRRKIIENFHFVQHSSINLWVLHPSNIKKFIKISDFDLTQLKELYKNDINKYVYQLRLALSKNYMGYAGEMPTHIVDGHIEVRYKEAVVKKQLSFNFLNSYKSPYFTHKNHLSYK